MFEQRKHTYLLFLNTVIFLFLFSSFAFTKEESLLYTPAVVPESDIESTDLVSESPQVFLARMFKCDPEKNIGACRRELKEIIKQDHYFFAAILGFAAAREEDASLCDSLKLNDECRNIVKELIEVKKMAEDKCEDLSFERKPLCVNMADCDKQSGDEMKDICRGLKSGDISLLTKAMILEGTKNNFDVDEVDLIVELAVYQGFKSRRSEDICKKYASELKGQHAYVCEVIFSTSPLDDILDSALEDITYFLLSIQYEAKHLCKQIKNENVKAGCFSSGVEEYFFN